MKLNLIELNDLDSLGMLYDIYKDCMFMPSKEKFNEKMTTFLKDDAIKIFACLDQRELKGAVVCSLSESNKIKIVGIAVEHSDRCKGIGTYIIKSLTDAYPMHSVIAETDKDAIGFYRKYGFSVTECSENYNGENIIRYRCELER